MNKKIFGMIFLILVLSMSATNLVSANGIGNEQYYTVYLDGEGDAIVMAKLTFQNTDTNSLDFVILEVPGQITVLNTVQEVIVRVEDDNYYRGYYDTTEYHTIDLNTETLSESTLLTVEFPEVIDEQETGTILLYYKVEGLAEENLGLYDFDFTSIKSSFDTYYVRVSAEAINGLVMSGVESDVNYQDWGFASGAVEEIAMDVESFASEDMEMMSSRIGYWGGFVKEAYGLDPYESFTVSGEYASSEFRLHLMRNLILGFLGLAFLVGVGLGLKKVFTGMSKKKKHTEMLLAGSLVGFLLTMTLALGMYVIENLYYWVGYQYDGLFGFLIGVSLFLISIAGVIIPGLVLGKKHKDLIIGLGTAGVTVATLFFSVVVIVIIFAVI